MTSRAAVEATLRVFPRGRTLSEILDHLGQRGRRGAAAAVNRELQILAAAGTVSVSEGGRWQTVLHSQHKRAAVDEAAEVAITGVPATAIRSPRTAESSPLASDISRPDPQALLRYYRSALRCDPRGATSEVHDRHGVTWQVLACTGSWWPANGQDVAISIRLEDLPEGLRRALSRRIAEEMTLAIGWPLAVGRRDGVPVVQPVGLLPARWSRGEARLTLHLEPAAFAPNPDWIRTAAKRAGWTAETLRNHLMTSDGLGLDGPEFGHRLREALAGQVQGSMDPSRLSPSIRLGVEGLVDAMALFLPTDSSFNAGAVSDIDRIASWSPKQIESTALGPLLGAPSAATTGTTPVLHPMPLNPEQIEAVRHAMTSPLSVVTGPPGTVRPRRSLRSYRVPSSTGRAFWWRRGIIRRWTLSRSG